MKKALGKLKKRLARKIRTYLYWHFHHDRVVESQVLRSNALYHRGGFFNKWRALWMWSRLQKKYVIYFHPQITIGKNLRIEHYWCVSVGQTAILGDNVRIYQMVQVIAKASGDQERVKKHERRHAKIGNNVVLCCGCIVIGPVTIGDNSVIGAGAIVTHDIPPDSIVTGINQIRPRPADMTLRNHLVNPLAKR
ncbi:MAG: serine acetyltransferase [Kiritimatiellae bacterium]|nr:serine acetyltransferase [Kiritimatiellia bacterium]